MVVRLEARGLSFRYNGAETLALQGIDLEVHVGELVTVLGPNGSGKSTLLKLLAGLLSPAAGSVCMDRRPLSAWSARERARCLAVVPQSLTALPEVTVEAFVGYGRYAHRGVLDGPHKGDREAILHALQQANLADLAQRPLAELSGGQRQRALVARALAQEARLLLVDEPTNALDPEHQLRVFELLADLCERDHSVVVATHELNLASQFASKALLLDEGRKVALVPITEVLRAEVLEPVYGACLTYGQLHSARAGKSRPFVLPWPGDGSRSPETRGLSADDL